MVFSDRTNRGDTILAGGKAISEFPVSKLEKRILWGIACAGIGMVLAFVLPVSLMNNGFYPESTGDVSGLGAASLIMVGIAFSGLAGLIARLLRPGMQAILLTLICLVLADICLMSASVRLYSVSAAIKVALMLLVFSISPKLRQVPAQSDSPTDNSD